MFSFCFKKRKLNPPIQPPSGRSLATGMPRSLREYILAGFLEAKSVTALSSTCQLFNAETKGLPYWKDKLAINKDLLTQTLKVYPALNLSQLYHALTRLPSMAVSLQHSWEVLCLSQELGAVQCAVATQGLTPGSRTDLGWNALHLAVVIGNQRLCAFVQGAVRGLESQSLTRGYMYFRGWNAMHLAAYYRRDGMIRFVSNILQLDPNAKTDDGYTPLHLAAWSGHAENVIALRLLFPETLDFKAVDSHGHDVHWFAKQSRKPELMEKAVSMSMDEIHQILDGQKESKVESRLLKP